MTDVTAPRTDHQRCRVVFMGMMGSGKSTIGRELASRTGWPYHDNDELLERDRGITARALLGAHGEDALRAAEAAALALGLREPEPCIIGAAAGTILDPDSRAAMTRDGLVVWLRASPATLAARAAGATHRPWLEQGEQWFQATVAERDPLYASVADVVVDTDHRSPAEVAAELLPRLVELCG